MRRAFAVVLLRGRSVAPAQSLLRRAFAVVLLRGRSVAPAQSLLRPAFQYPQNVTFFLFTPSSLTR
ncbi:hypothetical protein GCM10027515_05440 [Schumannella luteola]